MAVDLLPRTFRCKMLELLQTRELHTRQGGWDDGKGTRVRKQGCLAG